MAHRPYAGVLPAPAHGRDDTGQRRHHRGGRRALVRALVAASTPAFAAIMPFAAAAAPAGPDAAASWPTRPVRIVVPYSAGGLTDNLTRLFTRELTERFGQPFVLEFKPGAATNIGAATAAQAAPDGHTLFVSTIASNALNKSTYRKLAYDPDGFVSAGMMGINTFYLVVAPGSPLKTVDDLIRAAKANPAGLSYGSHGNGGPNHLITELFRRQAGIERLVHVPYKGSGESSMDLISGRIDFMIDGAAINQVRDGRLRAIAVAFPTRWPTQPDIPTMGEAGFPDVTITTFFGLAAPAGTPPAILDRLNDAMREIAGRPAIEKQMSAMNVMAMPVPRAEVDAFIQAQSRKWGPVLQDLGIVFD